jgi:hypothetical protein
MMYGNRDDHHLTGKLALTGTWKLVSVTSTTAKGEVIENPYGQNPKGLLAYTGDGRQIGIITNGGRKTLSIKDHVSAPVEERG